jgi:hypothetical protein
VLFIGVEQMAIRQILDTGIEAEIQIRSGQRRLQFAAVFNYVPDAVPKHTQSSRDTSQGLVKREFQTFLSLVVDIGKAQDLTEHRAGRVVATVFAFDLYAGNLKIQYPCGRIR